MSDQDRDDRWEKTFEDRERQLLRRSTRVMYFAEDPTTESFRYRVLNMISALECETDFVSASFFFETDGSRIFALLPQIDRLVVHRTPYSDFAARLILEAQRHGVLVFFDIDEYLFDIFAVPLIVLTLDEIPSDGERTEIWNDWFGRTARHVVLMERCDKIIAATHYLADRVEAITYKPTAVVRDFLSYDELAVSVHTVDVNSVDEQRDAANTQFVIGYLSGVESEQRNLEVASPGIRAFLDDHEDSLFRVVGPCDLELAGFGKLANRVVHRGTVAHKDLPGQLASVSVLVAPLRQNSFTDSKSERLYFSAAAAGVPTIASPTPPLRAAITPGVNGWLAEPEQWYDMLSQSYLVWQSGDCDLIEAAHSDAVSKFSPSGVIEELLKALDISA